MGEKPLCSSEDSYVLISVSTIHFQCELSRTIFTITEPTLVCLKDLLRSLAFFVFGFWFFVSYATADEGWFASFAGIQRQLL